MYIKLAKGKTNKDYTVYLVEGYRDQDGKIKHRTLKRYGYLTDLQKEDPDILNKLKEEAKNMASDHTLTLTIDTASKNALSSKPLNYGYFFLNAIYESLKIPSFISNHTRKYQHQYNLNHVMKLLVYSRILEPESKKATYEHKDRYFNLDFDFSLDDFYRSLTVMNAFKEDLELWVHKQIQEQKGRDCSLVFYDVTNYYFETEIQDEDEFNEEGEIIEPRLRRKGVSKEHRPNPIIQMGMFM